MVELVPRCAIHTIPRASCPHCRRYTMAESLGVNTKLRGGETVSSTIKVSDGVKGRLADLQRPRETYSEVVGRLLELADKAAIFLGSLDAAIDQKGRTRRALDTGEDLD